MNFEKTISSDKRGTFKKPVEAKKTWQKKLENLKKQKKKKN